jgi:hypothetical protein
MEATRAIGYSLETAIADIIDNSIAAKANEIDINFFPIGDPYITILDNGIGMNMKELIEAMRYGSCNPLNERTSEDLGRFGLGLKTASMSQCRRLSVISKINSEIVGAQWDLDYVASTGKWSLRILEASDINEFPYIGKLLKYRSGTLVVWQELDRIQVVSNNFDASLGKYMDSVRQHLSLVFHRYISGEPGIVKVALKINNISVEAIDPFLTKKSTQIMDEEIISIEGKKIIVRPYILPHISQLSETEISMLGGKDGIRKSQGFYVYRNKRLLVWGTWFKLMRKGELTKLARVQIDIPNSLDSHWALDIKKSMAIPPEVVRKNVSTIIERIGETSKKTWTFRGKKETNDSKVHIWNRLKTRQAGVIYEINRNHPMVQNLISMNTTDKRIIEQLLMQIEQSLPINQLYVDLTNDERIVNECEPPKDELSELVKQLISRCTNEEERNEMLQMLPITEPFDKYPELLSEIMQEVL